MEGGVVVNGGEDAGTGVGTFHQILHKPGVHLVGVGHIPVFALFREGVGFQPLQQFQVHAQGPVAVLGGVDVQVYQPWDNQLSRAVQQGQVLILPGQLGKSAGAAAVQAHQIAVGDGFQGLGVSAEADVAFQHERLSIKHGVAPFFVGGKSWLSAACPGPCPGRCLGYAPAGRRCPAGQCARRPSPESHHSCAGW